jgi:hypothetical protein
VLACAATARAAAIAAAALGARWRTWAAPRLGRDLPAALIEHALVLTLAIAASKRFSSTVPHQKPGGREGWT